jgi:hypothetical protein
MGAAYPELADAKDRVAEMLKPRKSASARRWNTA